MVKKIKTDNIIIKILKKLLKIKSPSKDGYINRK